MKPPPECFLIDDDPAVLRLLSAWLEEAGYAVASAVEAGQALAAIDAQPPDFLIVDWEMPHVTGLELCRRVRELPLAQFVYILLLAGSPQRVQTADGLEGGATTFSASRLTATNCWPGCAAAGACWNWSVACAKWRASIR